jgi:predicted phosphoribosyltransferase
MRFRDRAHAGRFLASKLEAYRGRKGLQVLALPRGGVPVAFEIATALGAPLDVFLVRKLGLPGQEELAMGAIASGGVRVLNDSVLRAAGTSPREVEAVAARETAELERRERLYRGERPPPDLRGKTVLLVDDGLATGASMRAAVAALRSLGPERLVVAVPVAPAEACAEVGREVDEVVCGSTPPDFSAVGAWYDDFSQTGDSEVRALLERARAAASAV